MNNHKHNADCLRRKAEHPFLCTCRTTDEEILAAERDQAERAAANAVADRNHLAGLLQEWLDQCAAMGGSARADLTRRTLDALGATALHEGGR